jgi:hypothetical protein
MFWMPVLVAVAYLPDIAAQFVQTVGLAAYGQVCHSIILAVPAAVAIAALLRWLFQVGWRQGLVLALISIVLHDLFDVLVGYHRLLWWPVSGRPVSFASRETGLSMTSEVLVFGSGFLVVLGVQWFGRRHGDPLGHRMQPKDQYGRPWRQVWVTGGITALLFLTVGATQYLRGFREQQLELAWTMINQKQATSALDLLDQAQRWPSTARPGQIDYARAEAYADLGERAKAEQYYLQSYRADPFYFWTVADLAVFYASSDELLEVRRRHVAPYLARLTDEFADEPLLPRYLAKLERQLSDSPASPVSPTE